MLTELVELGHKIKDIQNEIKQNIQGTNSDRKETRTRSNNLDQKEEMNIHREQNEKPEFKKMRRDLGISGTT